MSSEYTYPSDIPDERQNIHRLTRQTLKRRQWRDNHTVPIMMKRPISVPDAVKDRYEGESIGDYRMRRKVAKQARKMAMKYVTATIPKLIRARTNADGTMRIINQGSGTFRRKDHERGGEETN